MRGSRRTRDVVPLGSMPDRIVSARIVSARIVSARTAPARSAPVPCVSPRPAPARHVRVRPVGARSAPIWTVLVGAVLVGAWAPAAAAAAPAWLVAVRDAAYARARAPLQDDALDAALRERRRAAAGALPSLRLAERSRLGLDGVYALTLDAGVTVPVQAPAVAADARVTALRLARTRRRLAARRRAEAHDALGRAAALLALRERARALEVLARSAGDRAPASGDADATRPHTMRAAVDARLLLATRPAREREARRLRGELARSLSLTLPPADRLPAPRRRAAGPLLGALGLRATDLRPRRCLAASDTTALARLSLAEQRAVRKLREARAAPRVDVELGGTLTLGGASEPDARYAARVAVAVRLPPWSPASGAASLAAGAEGLEQQATLSWPNRTPGPPPSAPSTDAVVEADRAVLAELDRLQGQERDLTRRRSVLLTALASLRGSAHDGGYLRATLALQLADTEQALDLTALDAALVCGALPP